MRDYVQLPSIVDDFDELHSDFIINLIYESVVMGRKISLDYLREMYKKDRTQFLVLVDELSLRGFKFHTEKPNNLLPNYAPKTKTYINVMDNRSRYLEIDFNMLGLSRFTQRFKVNNDLFFHKVPLKGFKLLNANIDLEVLENEFIKAGFQILGNSGEHIPIEDTSLQEELVSQQQQTFKIGTYLEKVQKFHMQTKISTVFNGPFSRFCLRHGADQLIDLSMETMEQFQKSYGVGKAKANEVLDKLIEIMTSTLNELLIHYPEVQQEPTINIPINQIADLKIEDLYLENKYNRFLEYCKKQQLTTIGEIKQSDIDSFSKMSGVGIKKVADVVETIHEVVRTSIVHTKDATEKSAATTEAQLYNTTDESLLSIEEVFRLNKYNSFRRYCRKNRLIYVTDIKEEQINQFSNFPQVGIKRVQDVLERLREVNYSPSLNTFTNNEVNFDSDMYITELFADSKFIKFRSYCEEQKLSKVKEIQPIHLDEFAKIRGVGEQKVRDIRDILENFTGSIVNTQVIDLADCMLYEKIKDLPVSDLLNIFHFHTDLITSVTIQEIEGKQIGDLDEGMDRQQLLSLYQKLKKAKRPEQIANVLTEELKDNQASILKYRFVDKLTLQETGKHFGVTRERVRQIAKKTEKKVRAELRKYNFYEVIQLYSDSNTSISYDELVTLIGSEYVYIAEILKGKNKGFTYYEKLDMYFFNSDQQIDIKSLDNRIEDLPSIFLFEKYESTIREMLEGIGMIESSLTTVQKLLEAYGFCRYGKFYSSKKLNVIVVLEVIFEHYIEGQLRLDEDGYKHLQYLAKEHLDYELNSSMRAVDARLRDSSKIILVNRSTFQTFDLENFDQVIVSKVRSYLRSRFYYTNVVNIEEIFNEFENEWTELGIQHKLHLYSIIQYFLDEEFIIGKGNTLNIFKNDQAKLTIEESLMKAVSSRGGFCNKEELEEILHWPIYKIDLGISNSKQLLPWGKKKVITMEYLDLTKETKDNLISLVEKNMTNGFTTAALIYREVMFDLKLAKLIKEKGIDDYWKMSSILKAIFPGLKGHMNFLHLDSCPFTNFEEVIIDHFDRETTRKEMKDFTLKYGYKEVMASQVVYKLLEQGHFIEVDLDTLYPNANFDLPDSVINEVCAFVEEAKAKKEYIALNKIKGYKRRLSDIGFRWNPYLIKSILIKNGYRQIIKMVSDYRYDQIILVKENSSLHRFDELVHYILKTEYNGNMHETSVYEFLAQRGIFKEQERSYYKVLPNELKTDSKLIRVDRLGIVTLN